MAAAKCQISSLIKWHFGTSGVHRSVQISSATTRLRLGQAVPAPGAQAPPTAAWHGGSRRPHGTEQH